MPVMICKYLLILINVVLFFYLVVLLIDHKNAGHNLTSWASIFHLLSCVWLGIRGMFWIFTVTTRANWDVFTFYILYWIPNPIEFGSFMLLPLFFAQIVCPSEWHRYWVFVRPIYISVIFGLILFQAMWALLAAYEQQTKQDSCVKMIQHHHSHIGGRSSTPGAVDCYHTEYSSDIFRFITAFCFLSLAGLQGLYAYKIHHMDDKLYKRYVLSSRPVISYVNGILIFSFISRAIYQFLVILGLYRLPNIPIQGDGDVHFSILVFFTLWDYLPVMLLITTITSRVLGDNTYYTSSILTSYLWLLPTTPSASSSHSTVPINSKFYTSRTRSGENKRARGKGRGRGNSMLHPSQGHGLLPIDEESGLLSSSDNISLYGAHDTSTHKSVDMKSLNNTHISSSLTSSTSYKSLAIEIMKKDQPKHPTLSSSIRDPNHQIFNSAASSYNHPKYSQSYSSTNSNIYPPQNTDDDGYENYDDEECDPCSLDRFQAPSLRAILGNMINTTYPRHMDDTHPNHQVPSQASSISSSNHHMSHANPDPSPSTSSNPNQFQPHYRRRSNNSIGSSPPVSNTNLNGTLPDNLPCRSTIDGSNSTTLTSNTQPSQLLTSATSSSLQRASSISESTNQSSSSQITLVTTLPDATGSVIIKSGLISSHYSPSNHLNSSGSIISGDDYSPVIRTSSGYGSHGSDMVVDRDIYTTIPVIRQHANPNPVPDVMTTNTPERQRRYQIQHSQGYPYPAHDIRK